MTDVGCFATGTPLENHGAYNFQSDGNCQLICIMLNKNVLGLSDGENCWCGDMIPAKEWQLPDGNCSTICRGDKTHKCGGANKLWVKLTGQTVNEVEYFVPDVSSSTSKSVASVVMTSAAVRASATASSSEAETPDNGPNKAGIAAGVVVGVVAIAAIIGGVWFFLRRRRQQQAEDDYRRNAANVNSFVNGGKTSASSMNDSRLDPSFVDRRQSNGSIADNEDYSRRILKVTNV
jgi:cell wall integrity and stress response component